jgi:hypothetical protein
MSLKRKIPFDALLNSLRKAIKFKKSTLAQEFLERWYILLQGN